MSFRERLTFFITIVLMLFSINVGTDTWSNRTREVQIKELRDAVNAQLQASQFRQELESVQKAILLHSSLRSTMHENLPPQEINQALKEITKLGKQIHLFRPPLTTEQTYREFFGSFVEIIPLWRQFYRNYNNPRYNHQLGEEKRDIYYRRLLDRLETVINEMVKLSSVRSKNIDESERITRDISIIVFVISIISTLGISLLLISYTNRELNKLKQGATIIGGGNLEYRIPISTRDELGKVGESFNKMAAQLNLAVNESNRTRELADHANRSKSIFLANMSHELRTPLNAIIGYSEMMLEDLEMGQLDEEEQRSDLMKILYAGRHLLSQINDVLDFSKIETGNMTVYNEWFAPVTVLEGLMNTLSPLAKQHNNTMSFETTGDMPELFNDVTKFRQIFYNLLSNSCKFTKNGKIIVRADYDAVNNPKIARFKVIDNGIGMSKNELKKVFDAFIQADSSTTRKYGGTGLGLALCKQYISLMAGNISVESEKEIGTIFTLELKVQQNPEQLMALEISNSSEDKNSEI